MTRLMGEKIHPKLSKQFRAQQRSSTRLNIYDNANMIFNAFQKWYKMNKKSRKRSRACLWIKPYKSLFFICFWKSRTGFVRPLVVAEKNRSKLRLYLRIMNQWSQKHLPSNTEKLRFALRKWVCLLQHHVAQETQPELILFITDTEQDSQFRFEKPQHQLIIQCWCYQTLSEKADFKVCQLGIQ